MQVNKGVLYAACSYLAWGLFPIYWKALTEISPINLLAQRVLWSLGVALLITTFLKRWHIVGPALRNPKTLGLFVASGFLLGINWLVYIWTVQAGLVMESSLGYFINPLINVLLGVIFLHERLRMSQLVAIGTAAVAVLYLTFNYGSFPWAALTLAFSFGAYALLRKVASLDSADGLTVETMMMAVPAFLFVLYLMSTNQPVVTSSSPVTWLLLACSGLITTLPLLLFAAGARQVTMVTLGLLQYISPTMQFILGAFVYHEELTRERLIGFILIWIALIIYSGESFWFNTKRHKAEKQAAAS